MPVKRSEIRKALKDRMGQFLLNRVYLERRLRGVTAMKSIPLIVLLGEDATDRLLAELLEELHTKLGTESNVVILD